MHTKVFMFRISILTVLISCLIVSILPIGVLAQQPINCPYDKDAPSLGHARQTFKALNYNCAEMEIDDLLKNKSLSLEEKANAHVLMAAVYYAKLKDSKEKRKKVVEQFAKAFRSYANWSGDVDIKSTEFLSMMETAKSLVETELKAPETPDLDSLLAVPGFDTGEKKAWYKQWWAIGLGVGVVAGAVVIMGGGGDDPPSDTTLATFPPPPTKNGK